MLRTYLVPIGQAAVVFGIIGAAIWLPYVIWQYRRWGRVSSRKALVHSSFLLYLLCAWALVLLPFPDPSTIRHPAPVNLVPFDWWSQMWTALAKTHGGWRAWLTNAPLLVRVFNVALTVPLGVYLRRWSRRGFWATTLAGFGLSLAFELTQLTGIWGIYAVRYRSFDVDDLIANTAGAALGWVLAPLVVLLPSRRRSDDLPQVGSPSPARRLVALVLDGICWVLVYFGVLITAWTLTARWDPKALVVAVVAWTVSFLAVFVAVPALARGATPGRAVLGIAVRLRDGAPAPWWRLVIREAVLLWPVTIVPALGEWGDLILPDEPGWTLGAVVGAPAAWLFVLGLIALLRRDRRSLPDLIAGTQVVLG